MPKEIIELVGIEASKLPPPALEAVLSILPELRGSRTVRFSLARENPHCQEILGILETAGFKPWADVCRSCADNEFQLRIARTFTEQELNDAQFLVPEPCAYSEGLHRHVDGLVVLERSRLKKKAHIAKASPYWIIVSSALKNDLEKLNPNGMIFRPTWFGGTKKESPEASWKSAAIEPFWEMTASKLLPSLRLSDGLTILDDEIKLVLREGLYEIPQLCFNQSELDLFGRFDAGLTSENFSKAPDEEERILIVSNRIYKTCRAMSPKDAWTPVRHGGEPR